MDEERQNASNTEREKVSRTLFGNNVDSRGRGFMVALCSVWRGHSQHLNGTRVHRGVCKTGTLVGAAAVLFCTRSIPTRCPRWSEVRRMTKMHPIVCMGGTRKKSCTSKMRIVPGHPMASGTMALPQTWRRARSCEDAQAQKIIHSLPALECCSRLLGSSTSLLPLPPILRLHRSPRADLEP